MSDDIDTGSDLIWNNKFQEAEEIFKKKKSNDPRYALHFAEVPAIYIT